MAWRTTQVAIRLAIIGFPLADGRGVMVHLLTLSLHEQQSNYIFVILLVSVRRVANRGVFVQCILYIT